jgi:hypothetical protein
MKQCVPNATCTEVTYGVGNAGFWMNCCSNDNCNSADSLISNRLSVTIGILFIVSSLFNYF